MSDFIPISDLGEKTAVTDSDIMHVRSTGSLDSKISALNFLKSGISAVFSAIKTDKITEKTSGKGVEVGDLLFFGGDIFVNNIESGDIEISPTSGEATSYGNTEWTTGSGEYNSPGRGTINMEFSLRTNGPADVEASIFRNGVIFGTIQTTSSATAVIFNEDLLCEPEDVFQLMYKTGASTRCYAGSFKFKALTDYPRNIKSMIYDNIV